MSVYRPKNSKLYHYDFQIKASGFTELLVRRAREQKHEDQVGQWITEETIEHPPEISARQLESAASTSFATLASGVK